MNFREEILNRIIHLLGNLVIQDRDTQVTDTPEGTCILVPNDGYQSALMGPIQIGNIEELPIESGDPPVAFVDEAGGRHDLGIDTFIQNLVEVFSVRIEVLLDRKIGIADSIGPDGIRPITFQSTDLVHDIESLITRQSVQSAILDPSNSTHITDMVISEWDRDDRYRGGEKEILYLVYEIQVSNERQT